MSNIVVNSLSSSRKKFTRRKSFELYKQVIEFRKREFSYSEIRKETGLAKSTINNWLKYAGMTLSKEHLQIQAKNSVRNHIIATAASRITRARKKEREIQAFIQKTKQYFLDPFFVAGIMLYEAEGSKGMHNAFSNSDYHLIITYIRFLERYMLIDKYKDMTFRLYIHETRKDDLLRITNFWAKKISVNPRVIKISWKHNVVTKRRVNLDYVGQFNVEVLRFPYFTSKMKGVSDIILKQYLYK